MKSLIHFLNSSTDSQRSWDWDYQIVLSRSCTILKHFPLIKSFSHHFSRGTYIQTNGTNRQINANEKT